MSRKPVDQMAASRDPEGREALWPIIRDTMGEWFPSSKMFDKTYMDRRTINSYLTALTAGGYLEQDKSEVPFRYRLIKDAGVHAPRLRPDGTPVTQGSGTTNMWRSMRMMAMFSPLDLSLHSTTDTVSVTEQTAKAYCKMLLATGYLRVVQKAVPSRKQAVYRLVRNTGPKPPQIQRVKQVFDQNTREVHRMEDRA